MKKTLTLLAIGMSLALNLAFAPMASASYSGEHFWYYATSDSPRDFKDWEGNDWSAFRKRAEVERSSKQPTWHTDYGTGQSWACHWTYRKDPGGWFCEKVFRLPPTYLESFDYSLQCAYGYKLSSNGQYCYRVIPPENAHLNAKGNGWECNAGYRKNASATACDSLTPPMPAPTDEFWNPYYVYCRTYFPTHPLVQCARLLYLSFAMPR